MDDTHGRAQSPSDSNAANGLNYNPPLSLREELFSRFCMRPVLLIFASLICSTSISAQQNNPPTQPNDGKIYLDVVVTPKSGPPVTGLNQQDFTLLDHKVPRPISSFQSRGRSKDPVEVILVIDAVNANYETVGYERGEIEKYLRAESGVLAHPTTLALITDAGLQV